MPAASLLRVVFGRKCMQLEVWRGASGNDVYWAARAWSNRRPQTAASQHVYSTHFEVSYNLVTTKQDFLFWPKVQVRPAQHFRKCSTLQRVAVIGCVTGNGSQAHSQNSDPLLVNQLAVFN